MKKRKLNKNQLLALRIIYLIVALGVGFNIGLYAGKKIESEKNKPLEINIKGAEEDSYVEMRDLKGRVDSDQIRIVDIREFKSYQEGHIKNARSIPFAQLKDRLEEIPKDLQIIVYGTALNDQQAMEGYNILKEKRYEVKYLLGGFEEWKAANFPTEN